MTPSLRPSRAGRVLRILAKLALALGAMAVLGELGLRFLLFSDRPWIVERTKALRRAALFAHRNWDEEYWKLIYVFRGPERGRTARHDPELGWVRGEVTPGTCEHAGEADLRGRRPLLIFGDSFANCAEGEESCWGALLDATPRGSEYAVLNYGTGGYGLDQITISMQRALPRFAHARPVVAMTLLVDSDLERSTLRCRDWPKPHFRLDREQGLALDGPVAATEEEFLARHPLAIRSFLWRYFLHGSGLAPTGLVRWSIGEAEKVAQARELNAALLQEAVTELEASGVEYFFVLFHSRGVFGPEWGGRWEEPFVIAELERLRAPYVLSWPIVRRAALERGVREDHFYIQKGPGRNHYNAEGNAVVFEAFERGLARRFDDPDALGWLGWDFWRTREKGPPCIGRTWEKTGAPAALVLDLAPRDPLRMDYTLAGRATRLETRLVVDGVVPARGRLAFFLDGALARAESLDFGGAGLELELELELDLRGAQTLSIAASVEAPLTLRCLDPRLDEGL